MRTHAAESADRPEARTATMPGEMLRVTRVSTVSAPQHTAGGAPRRLNLELNYEMAKKK